MKRILIFISLVLFVTTVMVPVFAQDAKQKKIKPLKLSKEEKKEGYMFLFDGTSLNKWDNPSGEYIVENGTIKKNNGGSGNLYTKENFDNFVLRFDFLLTPAANNGLGLRHNYTTGGYDGMELQIIDNEDPSYKDLEPYQYHGSLYGFVPAKRGYLKKPGEWNTQEVMVNGNHLTIKVNDELILDTNLAEATKDAPATTREKITRPSGRIAFLGHNDVVYFKNIRVKKLAPYLGIF